MSVLPSQSWVTPNNPFFLLANVSTLTATNIDAQNVNTNNLSTGSATISSIKGTEGGVNIDFAFISSLNSDGKIEANEFSSIFTYAQEGTVSTLFTQHIILDQATLDVINGNTLLLNGVPLATTSTSISSLQDWSFFPALQVVDMNGFNLSNAGNINSQNIFNALNIQSDTFTGLTSITSPAGTITNLRATGLSTNTFAVNTINNGGNTNWVSPLSVSSLAVSSLTTPLLSVPVLQAGGVSSLTVSTGSIVAGTYNGLPLISGSNWSQYPANSAVTLAGNVINTSGNFNVNVTSNTNVIGGGDVVIEANGGLNIASITDITLNAYNGNRGQVNIVAGSGNNNGVGGTINLTADGGQVAGVGTGGTINLTANTPLGFSNLTSKISINASGVNSYAGSIPPLASVYGYNFIYGQLGVNICSGIPPVLPNVPGTTYLYGTLGVETSSDFYCPNIYPYWNGLTTPPDLNIEGRYILPNLAQVCVRMSNVRQIDFQSNVTTYMSNLDTLSMSSNGSISTSNLGATNATLTTLSNTNVVGSGSGTITGYSNITTSNLTTTTINGSAYPPPSGSVSSFTTASISSLTVSTINGFPFTPGGGGGTTNNFSTLFTSTLAFSTATSVGSNTLFNYPLVIDYDTAGNTTTAGVAIAVQNHNFGTGAVINRIEMGARANGANYIMSLWPGQNLEDLYIDSTEVIFNDGNFSTIVNSDPYGLQTNGIIQAGNISTVALECSTINGVELPFRYGSFTANNTQLVTASNTATDAVLDTTEIGSGVILASPTQVRVQATGVYRILASPQFATTSGGQNVADLWIVLNGTAVPRTNSQMTIQNNGQVFSSVEVILALNNGDAVGCAFGSADSNMALTYYPPGLTGNPETPALIFNVTQISS